MTMPHLMNCPHSSDSWCLACVKEQWDTLTRERDELREASTKPLDHHGPIDGMCFLGLNFTEAQFAAISSVIVDNMDPFDSEFGVEGAIVAVFAENARLRSALAKIAKSMECEPEKLLAVLKGDDA